MFVPAYFYKTDKLTDLSYAITFSTLALLSLVFGGVTIPSVVLFFMVFIWAARLGTYLFIRIRKIKKDSRFDDKRNNFTKFFAFWLLQGTTVWAVLIPSLLFFQNQVISVPSPAYFGVLIWGFGLAFETVADIQKYRFINNPNNKGKWIESGLWKLSRHPNYFGEITLWFGVYIFTLFGLTQTQSLIGLIGPVYISVLIGFVSGIPLLEKAADKRWGSDENYQKYKRRTSVLIPNMNKR